MPAVPAEGDAVKDPESIADEIVEDLFTNGIGDKAERLVLWREKPNLNMGGWGRPGARERIIAILKKHLPKGNE